MNAQVLTNLAPHLDQSLLAEYKRLSGKSDYEILTKQGGKLFWAIYNKLLETVPPKGSIRADLLLRLAMKGRIKIRPKVREAVGLRSVHNEILKQKGSKRKAVQNFNFGQALIAREIAVRESGRRVLALSAKYPQILSGLDAAQSRYGDLISSARVNVSPNESTARLTWRGDSPRAKAISEGIGRPTAQGAIRMAIADTERDIGQYVTRKKMEMAAQVAKQIIIPTLRRVKK